MSNNANEKQKMLQSFETAEESGYVALGQYIPVSRHTEKNVVSSVNYTVPIVLPTESKFNIYEGDYDYSYSPKKDKKEVRKQVFKSIFRVLKSLFFIFPYTENTLLENKKSKIKAAQSKTDNAKKNTNQFA